MKLLLYCTKQPHKLYATNEGYVLSDFELGEHYKNKEKLNGKIAVECDFEVEEIKHYIHYEPEVDVGVCVLPEFECSAYCTETLDHFKLLEKSCLKDYSLPNITVANELDDYLKGKNGYAIHIKNLHIFDEPKELEWNYHISYYSKEFQMQREKFLSKAPQNMCKVFNDNGDYILISIRPEWLFKILKGKKTIEVRKKVLKEMLK